MRPRHPRPVRWAAVAGVVLAAGCGGGSAKPPPPAAVPAPGHGSPQAATVGFLRGLTVGARNACAYVAPQNLIPCVSAFPATTTFSVTNLGVGQVTVRGAQAVVTILGTFCTTQSHQTTCATNASTTTGQPHGTSAGAFAAAYHPSQPESIGKRTVPCQNIGGQWYVDLVD